MLHQIVARVRYKLLGMDNKIYMLVVDKYDLTVTEIKNLAFKKFHQWMKEVLEEEREYKAVPKKTITDVRRELGLNTPKWTFEGYHRDSKKCKKDL